MTPTANSRPGAAPAPRIDADTLAKALKAGRDARSAAASALLKRGLSRALQIASIGGRRTAKA